MRFQRKFGSARPHAQNTEPKYITANLAQRVDNGLTQRVWRHIRHQTLFNLRAELQTEWTPRHDKNPAETATAYCFGEEGLSN